MGTGSVESLVLKWLGRLSTVPVPFFGLAVVIVVGKLTSKG